MRASPRRAARAVTDVVEAYRTGSDVASSVRLCLDAIQYRALRHLPALSRQRSRRVNVGDLNLEYRVNRGDIWTMREVFTKQSYYLPPNVFPSPPRTLLDLGANIGLVCAYYHREYQLEHIVAVEPDCDNLVLLRANAQHNALPISVVPAAVGRESGRGHFRCSKSGSLGRVADDGDHMVEVVSVADLLDSFPGGRADIVKIDIEGGEADVFAGDLAWLRRVRVLVAEMHPSLVDAEAVIAQLERAGMRHYRADSLWPGQMTLFSWTPLFMEPEGA